MNKLVINVPMYDSKVTVCFKQEDLPKSLQEHQAPYACFEVGDERLVICEDRAEGVITAQFLQCLSHELNHTAIGILHDVGIPVSYEVQEPLCYLQDFLLRKVLNKLMKDY